MYRVLGIYLVLLLTTILKVKSSMNLLYEDDSLRTWNITLVPGEKLPMYTFENDYHFVVTKPSLIEIYNSTDDKLFKFQAEGTLGMKVVGDYYEPVSSEVKFPAKITRTCSIKNVGNDIYQEILFEKKKKKDEL